jgi:hypothetical protein
VRCRFDSGLRSGLGASPVRIHAGENRLCGARSGPSPPLYATSKRGRRHQPFIFLRNLA